MVVFQPNALTHNLLAPRHLATKAHCFLIRHPHLGQEAARVQAGKHCCVNDVRFDPRLGDQVHLPGR